METSTRSVGTTLWRGLTALHAGIQMQCFHFTALGMPVMYVFNQQQKWRASIAYLSAMNQERSLE